MMEESLALMRNRQ